MDALWLLDREWFRIIHEGWRLPWLSPIMIFASMSGVGHVHLAPLLCTSARAAKWKPLPYVLAILFGGVVYVVGERDHDGLIQLAAYLVMLCAFWHLDVKVARQAIVAFLLSGACHLILKQAIARERPSNFSWAVPLENVYLTRSFPSGHTCTSVGIGILIFLALPSSHWRWAALAWGLLVGLSRIYVGVHFPTDVLAGIACGIASASAARLIGLSWEARKNAL